MPSGPKRRKAAAKKKKHQTPIFHSSPTIQDSSACESVVSAKCAHMEEEYANHRLEEVEKEVVLVDDGILKEVEEGQEPKNSEYVKEIDIGDDVSSSSSSEEESQLEENSSEFVEEERLEEKKQEEVCEDLAMVESEKIEEKLTQSLVSNGTKETELAETEEKNEETAGVVDLASEGKLEDLLEESVAVPAGESSNVSEHQNESEIPESTGYQQPILPVTRRTLQPTSWRSCCGLFEVLRRSDT